MKKFIWFLFINMFLIIQISAQSNGVINRNFSMQNVILPDTKPEEWNEIRMKVKDRILDNWGIPPEKYEPRKNTFFETETYNRFGLKHIRIRYHVAEDMWDKAIIILPPGFDVKNKYKAFIAIHGTNWEVGGYQMTDSILFPDRAYALEMAMKGYVCIAPDHFGFGDTLGIRKVEAQNEIFTGFLKQHPQFTIVGRQILGFIRACDVLDQLPYVEHGNYATMGNSLGGRSSLYLAAMDERINACVVSTGVSPFSSNVYRMLNPNRRLRESNVVNIVEKAGKFPHEVQEIISLIAPRSVLFIEPFNDPYNPYTFTSVQAMFMAQDVWKLLDKEKNIHILIHGDGHTTLKPIRDYAYEWIKRNYK